MSSYIKLLIKILQEKSDSIIPFADKCNLLKKLNFTERIRGDHYILTKENVEEILNLQPMDSKSKPYQVKQVRNLIVRYRLTLEETNDK